MAKKSSLTHILDNVQDAHKKDVNDLTSGFLNPASLYQFPRAPGIWANSQKPTPLRLPKTDPLFKQEEHMDKIDNFNVGSTDKGKVLLKLMDKGMNTTDKEVQLQKPIAWHYKEEHTLEQTSPRVSNKQIADEKRNVGMDAKEYKPIQFRFKSVVPTHLNSVTRRDQYHRIKQYESNVLLSGESHCGGVRALEHVEEKLRKDLEDLHVQSSTPNFHRLQIYSDRFQELTDVSCTFRGVLNMIKKEYDDYLSALLDQQPLHHKNLMDQVEEISDRGTYNPQLLTVEQQKLEQLSTEAKRLLEENSHLRSEISKEQTQTLDKREEEIDSVCQLKVEPILELTDKIEEAHAAVLEKLDEINDLWHTLRTKCVPSVLVSHLEQSIKETDVELQRSQSQKKTLKTSCFDLENELRCLIEGADKTHTDAERIWGELRGNGMEEGVREKQWGWYIS